MIEIHLATNRSEFKTITDLATVIWQEHYTPIIGVGQVAYMLDNFQSVSAIESQIQQKYQ